ncbi:MAG TPA: hypothetical protein DCQ31_07470 [Bacteroidales bacterium]|nr:hypothetical protein [Bacteroidales bacterium]
MRVLFIRKNIFLQPNIINFWLDRLFTVVIQINYFIRLFNLRLDITQRNGYGLNEIMEAAKYCSLEQITSALYNVGGQYRKQLAIYLLEASLSLYHQKFCIFALTQLY